MSCLYAVFPRSGGYQEVHAKQRLTVVTPENTAPAIQQRAELNVLMDPGRY